MKISPAFGLGVCTYFTDGKEYAARPVGSGSVVEVLDDGGSVRVVCVEHCSKCPHIILRGHSDKFGPWQMAAGEWHIIHNGRRCSLVEWPSPGSSSRFGSAGVGWYAVEISDRDGSLFPIFGPARTAAEAVAYFSEGGSK